MPKSSKYVPVGSQNHSHPKERVRALRVDDTIKRNLATHQEDEQCDHRPEGLLSERDLCVISVAKY